MKEKKKPLYLYEALELRSEYDARIKTLNRKLRLAAFETLVDFRDE